MPRRSTGTREKILETAGNLFFQQGYHAVGVDTIVRESGVAKMTLYRHFPSKDDLIVRFLEEMNEQFMKWFERSLDEGGDDPRDRILAFFGALQKLVSSPRCFGCPFIMAASEFPEDDSPGHRVSREHKRRMIGRFSRLAAEAGALQPDELAAHLHLLMDGAFSAARMFGVSNPGNSVRSAAEMLLEAHIPSAG